MVNADIEEMEKQLKQLEETNRIEAAQSEGGPQATKKFDIRKVIEKKKEQEMMEGSKPQEDMYTIKLKGLPNDITEDDIFSAAVEFGPTAKVKIPVEEIPGRPLKNRGFAFVTFEKSSDATKVID